MARNNTKKKTPKPVKQLLSGMDFEYTQLLELRKVLFLHGLTLHQLFGHFIDQIVLRDEQAMQFLQGAQTYKRRRMLEGREEKVDAETMYGMIEQQLANENKR